MTPAITNISKVKLHQIPPRQSVHIFDAQPPMKSILSNRPMSAYVSSATLPKQPAKSKALFDFTDQIQDLREKEVNLEKAKADFWLAAENQRYNNALIDLQRQNEAQTVLIKQQHEAQLKMIQKEHQSECHKLEAKCELLQKQANDSNQADKEAFKAQLDHLKQEQSLQLQSQNQRNHQKIHQIQSEMKEQLQQNVKTIEAEFKIKLKQAKALQKQNLELQIQVIVSKLSDESYEAMKQLKDELKQIKDENVRLAFEFRDLQTRNRRQEDYIFELRQNLASTQKELVALKQNQENSEKETAEISTQTSVQTYSKETNIEGLEPKINQNIIQYPSCLSNEELQEIILDQNKQIQKLREVAFEQQSQQDHFFKTIKTKVFNIMRQSHTQLQSFKKQQMQDRLQYDELAYMLTMLQPKQKTVSTTADIVKIVDE